MEEMVLLYMSMQDFFSNLSEISILPFAWRKGAVHIFHGGFSLLMITGGLPPLGGGFSFVQGGTWKSGVGFRCGGWNFFPTGGFPHFRVDFMCSQVPIFMNGAGCTLSAKSVEEFCFLGPFFVFSVIANFPCPSLFDAKLYFSIVAMACLQ